MFFKKGKKPPRQIIAIGGKKFSGKSEVSNMLMMGLIPETWAQTSTSEILVKRLAMKMTNALDKVITPDDIKAEKEKYRDALIKVGKAIELKEKAALVKSALCLVDDYQRVILDSIRRESEYNYMKEIGAQLILVEATPEARAKRGCKNPESDDPTECEGYNLLRADKDTWVIDNSKDLEHLKKEVVRFVEAYRRMVR